ncbi:MAG: glutaminyl-peptide cyclotransferase [Candidatus Dadabacteria bacterium]|nr:MAG: glutaminyl-peptide cyclotransferase [Candidatus Dadabacteria bacterium]
MKFSTTLIRSLKCSTVILGLVICFSFWHSDYLVAFTNSSYANEKIDTPVFGYKIVNTYPHNTNSFTQGLIFDKGVLYESTGLNGRSAVKIVDLKTGKTLKSHELPDNYFGEGIAIIENKIIQLTWRSKTGFVYDKKTLKLIKKFSYQTQGWGITYDGKYLIISDGSAVLYFMDPNTFKVVGTLEVYGDNGKVSKLNELEYINGEIYANIWGTEKIAKINPKNGRVTAWIDLSGLLNKEDKKNRVDVLNGIAFNSDKGSLFVTGKLWPKMFEIELVPKN